jgi:hypothetical protein
MALKWYGDRILKDINAETKKAMTGVMADCINEAKHQHPPRVVTGTFQGSIRLRPVIERAGKKVGFWGAFNVNYAIYLELGTVYIPEYRPLRNAADQWYPTLARRLRGIV